MVGPSLEDGQILDIVESTFTEALQGTTSEFIDLQLFKRAMLYTDIENALSIDLSR